MALPFLFANVTEATGAQLDEDFAAVGAIGVVPCTVSGTNALTLSPTANNPSISAYANYLRFSAVAPNTSTNTVTAQVGSLASLPVYVDSSSGPTPATAGDIVAANAIEFVYDSALNSGGGGFHLTSIPSLANVPIAAHSLYANATGGSAVPTVVTQSQLLDAALGGTQGDVAYRNATVWTVLAPGSAGQPLVTGGASANPQFGETQTTGIVAAGTTTSLATVLTAAYNVVATVGSGLGVRLPALTQAQLVVINEGANTLHVYPPLGAQIDALGTNTATTIATLGIAGFYAPSATQVYTVFTH